ncbi:hypothetical protein PJKIFABJ_00197 [Pseudomonas phage PE09]|uniref:Uncharacterized protein n=2 Tax=Otagovirus TaxID=2560197 RepID=A0A7S7YCS1_9CAUD|nr:hypothetical protein QGX22_gp057 [Pseudomonas phage PE09]YP_010768484.1 hypothetical protein QGX23_gp055 [Pseudomonas phage PN09]QHZ60133.1 hypothetical protein PJKIFABJ_00197 [Pseudomonas phage PE09]QPB10597.1 hypothetical protein PN09_176 [Pseudomonas phage PN09]
MFTPTHVIMTQLDSVTPHIVHLFKFGTEVEWIKASRTHIMVRNANGSVQWVYMTDLRLMTEGV